MLLSMINYDFSLKSFVMMYVEMFANIYLYLPLIFAIGENRHVVEYDKLRFQPEIICNAV